MNFHGWEPAALGTHAAGKGLDLNIKVLRMVENCSSDSHLASEWEGERGTLFPDFIIWKFGCWWLSEEGTSGEHLRIGSRRKQAEGLKTSLALASLPESTLICL